MGEMINAYDILVGKPDGMRPLGRPGRGWEDNIRVDLREIGWGECGLYSFGSCGGHWWALMNTAMNHLVP
jgi:hypothetical protein